MELRTAYTICNTVSTELCRALLRKPDGNDCLDQIGD